VRYEDNGAATETQREYRLRSFELTWGDPPVKTTFIVIECESAGEDERVIDGGVIRHYPEHTQQILSKEARGKILILKKPQLPRSRRIALPPGMLLDRVTRFLLTREVHQRFVEPVIVDMRVEYCDALALGHLSHARWIAARVYLLVIPGYLYGCVARAVKRLFST